MRLGEQKSQLLLRWPGWPISEGQCPTSGCGKIAIFLSDCSPIHDGDVAILDTELSARIRYGNLAQVTAAGRSTAFKIAAKKLQIEIRLLTYRPIQRYRQLLTTYRLATIHLLQLKRRLRDDISYPRLNGIGYSKGNKIITVEASIPLNTARNLPL